MKRILHQFQVGVIQICAPEVCFLQIAGKGKFERKSVFAKSIDQKHYQCLEDASVRVDDTYAPT